MSARPAALVLLLLATSARALKVGGMDPDLFVARSRKDPARLYALVVGATWCKPCARLAAELAAVDVSSAPALAAAAWDRVEVDEYGQARYQSFLSRAGASDQDGIPYVLVFRDGRALGATTPGDNLDGIAKFMADAARRPPGRATGTLPRLLCPGRKDDASFTYGVSGWLSQEDHSTDRFGVGTLLAFAAEENPNRTLLFAPSTGTASATEPAESGWGVFFVRDPIAPYAKRIQTVSLSTTSVETFSSLPGRRLRLVLTGHGGPQGIVIGYTPQSSGGEMSFGQPIFLTEPLLTRVVAAARRGGKEVRGLVLTCFGGQFGESFMPSRGAAAPACAAFATLPEKTAEGCYHDDMSSQMRDYATTASRALDCAAPQDGRRLHYQVSLATASRDVPMLSSEYFLLYGPAASFLGRGATAPAPSRGIARYDLSDGVEVFMDLVGGGVLAARKDERPIAPPRLAPVDCRRHGYSFYSLDGKHAVGAFYLRGRVTGPKPVERSDCSPVVVLRWDPEDGEDVPEQTLDLDAVTQIYAPTQSYWNSVSQSEFASALAPGELTVSTRGLKREARVLLTTVLPDFARPLAGAALEKYLDEVAARLKPEDAPLADALSAMARVARADARARQAQMPASLASPLAALSTVDASTTVSVAAQKEPDPGNFNSDELTKAMWRNIGPGDYETYEDISLFRLAHLAAAAEAELALRDQARQSPKARTLVSELDSLQDCERGLY
ncbi:MAG: hypothetical protein HKL90_15445 [Elusimicrobia bacterium]|nr:hypothetical protein [Elusimicrobiota bacterium]